MTHAKRIAQENVKVGAMSRRSEQISSNMKRILQDIIARRLSDPRIKGMITITEIDLSKDLRDAIIKLSIFPDKYESVTFHGLKAATMRIQKLMNNELVMRRPPHIRFEIDDSLKKQAAIISAINLAIHDGDDDIAENNDVESTDAAETESSSHPSD